MNLPSVIICPASSSSGLSSEEDILPVYSVYANIYMTGHSALVFPLQTIPQTLKYLLNITAATKARMCMFYVPPDGERYSDV